MKDDYTKATYALTISLEKYITLDPYDRERFEVIKVTASVHVLVAKNDKMSPPHF